MRHWAIEANGASLPVVEQGEGPAVLFLHGSPDTAERGVADASCLGFGGSYSPDDPSKYSGAYNAGDLRSPVLNSKSRDLIGSGSALSFYASLHFCQQRDFLQGQRIFHP